MEPALQEAPLPKYIAIEGPIGVGKTTLAHKIAETFNYDVFLEQPAENPFLPRIKLLQQIICLFELRNQQHARAQIMTFVLDPQFVAYVETRRTIELPAQTALDFYKNF